LEKTGMVLGVVGDQTYTESEVIQLAPGDVLFAHTDGVDEAMSPQRQVFGVERLQHVLARSRQGSAEEVLSAVERALWQHVGDGAVEDDFTMIAVKLS
jgi:sigma-B regulation protein RsbU (phosphoserine phosphatase)